MPAWRNKLHTQFVVISHLQCCIKLFWLRALSFLFWSANQYKFIHQKKTSSWRTSYNHTHSNEKLSISQTTCSPSIHRSYITWTELPDTIQTWFDTPFILWIKHSGLQIIPSVTGIPKVPCRPVSSPGSSSPSFLDHPFQCTYQSRHATCNTHPISNAVPYIPADVTRKEYMIQRFQLLTTKITHPSCL